MLDQWTVWSMDAFTGSIMDKGKKRERSAIGLLRAIGWISRKAQCQTFMKHTGSPTNSQFWTRKAVERKETMPVPGGAIADFEWSCHGGSSPMAEVIFYSTFLLVTWAGIRFADAQRCKSHSPSIGRGILRGECWQIKTSTNGQPWGANPFGVLGRPPSWGWGHHWITAINEWLNILKDQFRSNIG